MPRLPSPPNQDDFSFSARLRRFRIHEDITIEQSALRLAIPVGTLRGWENGKRPSDPEAYNRIIKELKKSEKKILVRKS